MKVARTVWILTKSIDVWIVRDGDDDKKTEKPTFKLPINLEEIQTENLMFLSKRIVEKKAKDEKGAQLAVTQDLLMKAYNGTLDKNDKGKNYRNEEKEIYPLDDKIATGEFEIDIRVENKELVLEKGNMSVELFKNIKETEGAEIEKPYYITITDGSGKNPKTKIARIEFKLDGDVVRSNLVK